MALMPLSHLIQWASIAIDLKKLPITDNQPQEVAEVTAIFNQLLDRLSSAQESLIASEQQAAIGRFSAQIAHDIRSPLAAFSAVEKELHHLPEDFRLIVRSAVDRIRDIANQLVAKNREFLPIEPSASDFNARDHIAAHHLLSILETIAAEKRLQYQHRTGVKIETSIHSDSYGLFACAQVVELKKLLSNLVDNSIEAMKESGKVSLSVSAHLEQHLQIRVQDDGKGISDEIICRLGQRGATYGKIGGSGLGLFHAFGTIKSWGGKIEIQSKIGEGTTIAITLPKAQNPKWFLKELQVLPGTIFVILDDDESIHRLWDRRFGTSVSLVHLSTPDQLRKWCKDNFKVKRVQFLLDYELIGFKETGLDLVEELNIAPQSIIVSSGNEDPKVQMWCERLNIYLIPKDMTGCLPIKSLTK